MMHAKTDKFGGFTLWLSAADTYAWANNRPNARCSTISGKRLRVEYADSLDVHKWAINGRHFYTSVDLLELDAIIDDHRPLAASGIAAARS